MGRPDFTTTTLQVYRALLVFYPSAFRRAYGPWMRQTLRDQCREAADQGRAAWIMLWWRTLGDLALTAVAEHLASRKGRIMQTLPFRNQPDRITSLLFLIPGLLLSLFYLLTIHSGEITGYMGAALLGAGGFILGRLKFLRPVRIWEQFTLGFVIGVVGFLVLTLISPLWNPGIPALRSQPWPEIRALLAIAICPGAMALSGRWLPRPRRWYWAVTVILLGCGLLRAFLPLGPNEQSYYLWNISWAWGGAAAIIGVVAFGVHRSRCWGILALLMVIVALGTLSAVNMMTADVAEGTTPFGQMMLLLGYLIPLVVCPAWLLFAPTWAAKKYGVLLSWGVLWGCSVLVLPLADEFLKPHFFFRLNTVDILGRFMTETPLLIGLWLAFTLYERQVQPPALDLGETTSPLTPARAES